MDLKNIEQQIVELSRTVGDWMFNERKNFSQQKVEEKSFNNLVSYVDKEAEQKFVAGLESILPTSGFIAEEGTSNKKGEQYNWIIDPLDGTTNFIHGIPAYCTSIALIDDLSNELLIGVIYDPNQQECFHASKGNGALLNGIKISVSPEPKLERSLIATGFPYDDFKRQKEYMDLLLDLMHQSRGIRRLGSAAIDLAYVACGRFETFYEYGLNPWDVAAGALIVKEAGGEVSDFSKGNNYVFGEEILTSNNTSMHHQMLENIGKWFDMK